MKKKLLKFLGYFLVIVFVATVLMIVFSPYGHKPDSTVKRVEYSVIINAPVEDVFAYLGNSDNAKNWSVFVDHINTLNADEVADGAVGSLRRCFVNADETGTHWDEETVEVILNEKRRLTIFNMQGFPMSAENLATEQLYKALEENQCELTFTVFFTSDSPGLFDQLKMYFAAYRIKSIFKGNMENIKRDVEDKIKVES